MASSRKNLSKGIPETKSDLNPLKGRVALVAGATRGVGRGIALALGEAGATVYCTGRSSRAAYSGGTMLMSTRRKLFSRTRRAPAG